eukprot:COSAG05_NODE_14850_length_385_cov_0.888112_2_plen_25_part_01
MATDYSGSSTAGSMGQTGLGSLLDQ